MRSFHGSGCRRSTIRISIQEAEKAAPGSVLYIGTESNLVHRLRERFAGKIRVEPLMESTCSNMLKVDAEHLLHTLEAIRDGKASAVQIEQVQDRPGQSLA